MVWLMKVCAEKDETREVTEKFLISQLGVEGEGVTVWSTGPDEFEVRREGALDTVVDRTTLSLIVKNRSCAVVKCSNQ